MAEIVDISTLGVGVTYIVLDGVDPQSDSIAIQVISDATLDGNIALSLAQGNDPDSLLDWHDLPEAPIIADIGAFSNLLQTLTFKSNLLVVKIDKLSATVGILTIINPNDI